MDYQSLEHAIASLTEQSQQAAQTGRGWKEVWVTIRAVNEAFRIVRYPTKTDRSEAWDRFQTIIASVKESQDEQRKNAVALKDSLARRISDLEGLQRLCINRDASWKDFWATASDVHSEMQTAHLATKAEKDELWQRLSAIKAEGKEYAAIAQRERDERIERSSRHRNEIAKTIDRARPLTDLENSLTDLILFLPKLTARAILSPVGLYEELDERRGELQACSERMREAWNLFESYKHDMRGQEKREMFERLRKAQDTLDEAWARYKESRADARNTAAERRAANAAKHEAFLERVQANIAKLEERLSRLHDIKEHKRNHLSDLQGKLDEARSDGYRTRVEGWIDEEESKLRNVEEQIEQVEAWLQEAKEKANH